MQPTFAGTGEPVVYLSRRLYAWPVCRNDVVLALSPVQPWQMVCKRVAATVRCAARAAPASDARRAAEAPRCKAGEWIEPEPWRGADSGSCGGRLVPPGQVWLLGDNANNSRDSRFYGPVPQASIVGRAVLRLWPPSIVR